MSAPFRQQGRVYARALARHPVTEAVGSFCKSSDPQREVRVDRRFQIRSRAALVPTSGAHGQFGTDGPIGLTRDAVKDTAAAATAKDQRVRPAQALDPLDIVEVSEIFDIVAHAIDEEVRG